jgi:hypothetical protein
MESKMNKEEVNHWKRGSGPGVKRKLGSTAVVMLLKTSSIVRKGASRKEGNLGHYGIQKFISL